MRGFLFLVFLFSIKISGAQEKIEVYPTYWWVGMKWNMVQLMVHETDPNFIINVDVKSSSPDLKIVKVNKVENKRYLFLDVIISQTAKPQIVTISLGGIILSEWRTIRFELKPRRPGNGTAFATGIRQEDFVYLLLPDRFANGDPSNDAFPDMLDKQSDNNNPFLRHGGDIQGVINHLDYLKSLGVTSLWMTPVTENNTEQTKEGESMRSSYHGYHFTDHFKIDKRYGGNEEYKRLSNELHKRGMKLVQDAVYNHVGKDHFFITDMPMKDWVNQWPSYQNTSYKDQPLIDPYASDADKRISERGWFTSFLPDLNQRNPYVANFLIQYAIWNTEEFGLDGWRVDTYFYSDANFLNRVNAALLQEYPKITVFGEAWVHNPVNSAYFCQNNLDISFKHNLQGVTDFPLLFAMFDGLNQPFGWTEGINRVYNTLAQDIVYKDPTRNCIFFDNHDLDRMYSVIGEDFEKFKMAINWLLTLRGIPQLYYGTEVLMKNLKNPSDAEVRKNFPGGWNGDISNKFSAGGRNEQENAAWNYIAKLANFRKTSQALKNGRLMQYLPEEGVYTYFRYSPLQTIMVVSHTGTKDMDVKMNRFEQRTKGFTKMKNVQTGEIMPVTNFTIKPKQAIVFELIK